MIIGTYTHLSWIIKNGFLAEQYNATLFTKMFWDSLLFLDFLAAILLILKPKKGIFLTLTIIVIDVIHNNIFYFEELYLNDIKLIEWLFNYWMILGQILFAFFVIITFKLALKGISNTSILYD